MAKASLYVVFLSVVSTWTAAWMLNQYVCARYFGISRFSTIFFCISLLKSTDTMISVLHCNLHLCECGHFSNQRGWSHVTHLLIVFHHRPTSTRSSLEVQAIPSPSCQTRAPRLPVLRHWIHRHQGQAWTHRASYPMCRTTSTWNQHEIIEILDSDEELALQGGKRGKGKEKRDIVNLGSSFAIALIPDFLLISTI